MPGVRLAGSAGVDSDEPKGSVGTKVTVFPTSTKTAGQQCEIGTEVTTKGDAVRKLATTVATVASVAFALLGGGMPTATAHDAVVRSNPADGGTVQQAPKQLELEFSGIPKETFNTVALSNQNTGEVLFSAQPQLDQQHIRVDVPEGVVIGPGKYKIGFQITSSDGHATRGMTTFTVAGEAPANAKTSEEMVASSSEAPYSNQQFLNWLIAGFVGVVVLVVGIVVALAKRKK